MTTKLRKVDAKSRVVLPEAYANKLVTVEAVGDGELRIRVSGVARVRPSFARLVSAMADCELPERVADGVPLGSEWQ